MPHPKRQKMNIEEELDSLLKGFWFFKEKVTITLSKLDPMNKEVYCVSYDDCRLNKYHGKNFTYKANDPHQWYLEFTFKTKNSKKNHIKVYQQYRKSAVQIFPNPDKDQ